MTTAGDALTQWGMAAHVYAFNADMANDCFFNEDVEMLIVPLAGGIRLTKRDNTMAFLFETRFPQLVTPLAAGLETLQDD